MPTLINVYGSARSGSTMLDLILGNSPDAFSCGEVSAWFRPYRRHHFAIDCSCGRNPCPVWERIGHVNEKQFYYTVIRELGVSYVVDSSKDLCWLLDGQKWTASSQIQTFNLLVWKAPVELAYSHWKRDGGRTDWREQFIRSYSRFFETGLPFSTVNYGALAQNPQQELTAICAAVGMTYREGRERFWEKEHHYLFGSLGVRKQVEARDSTMKPRPPFPPEFEAKRNLLDEQVANDVAVQEVLRMLQQADVSFAGGSGNRSRPIWPKKLSPMWYPWKKMTRLLRRYIPEPYDTTAP